MAEAFSDTPVTQLTSAAGMRVEINANGSLRRCEWGSVCLPLFVGNELEGGPTNIFLRRHAGPRRHGGGAEAQPDNPTDCAALLGPSSRTSFRAGAATLVGTGSWLDIHYTIVLLLAQSAPAWFWHVWLENTSAEPQTVDLTYAQDVALAPYGAIRLNEFYVSQYIDHTPLQLPEHGFVVASRQNQAVEGRYPWCLIGSLRRSSSFGTDALQLRMRELPGRRLQHEHSMVTLRDAPVELERGQRIAAGFFGIYLADHPEATSCADLRHATDALSLPEAVAPAVHLGTATSRESHIAHPHFHATSPDAGPNTPPSLQSGTVPASSTASLFSSAPLLEARELDTAALRGMFTAEWRHEELDEHGKRLSFFHGEQTHVVLRRKELRVLRPHGMLLRTGRHTTPDETGLTSTAWMSGVFHSMITQGHVSINRFLSTVHSYIGLFRSHGQRVFVELGGRWHLLSVPSAFEMAPQRCRWIYRHAAGVIEVRSEARSDPHELLLSIEVTSGEPLRFLLSHHVALNDDDGSAPGAALWSAEGAAITVAPAPGSDLGRRFPNGSFRLTAAPGTRLEQVGGDELLFLDGVSRRQPFVCLITAPCREAELSIRGELIAKADPPPLLAATIASLTPKLSMMVAEPNPLAERLSRLADMAPWYAQNAWVHYLSPRGLEQYSGGGWGTRDVCQGPVELLLALGQIEPIRDLLLRVMRAQNPDGDWPQWFMFFERERGIRAGDSHGDIVFWPLVVLAQYLVACGDSTVLEEQVPFFDSAGPEAGERATVWQHVQRALALITRRVIPGTSLAAYGHGDWNDSLQPADPGLREHLCSAWTVTLHHQALVSLAAALRSVGLAAEADTLERSAASVRQDFQRLLLVDGVLAGYVLFESGTPARYLLHPRDDTTGVRYSSLAMIHAILEDMLTPAQAREHLELIESKLSAPDGVRLFDRPMRYNGGPQRLFQRAETASFFGREIGLMYMHAHLRFAQALAHVGEAERFFHALCQANPIGIRSIVPAATLRQANCYYSSSDAAFADRYQASEQYERVFDGTIPLDGGWRVYSSGAGIALSLLMRHFVGVSREASRLRVDPVIPAALDGLRVATTLLQSAFEIHYRIRGSGSGVQRIELNGTPLEFQLETNPYRRGAALVALSGAQPLLGADTNTLTIELGS